MAYEARREEEPGGGTADGPPAGSEHRGTAPVPPVAGVCCVLIAVVALFTPLRGPGRG